MYIKFFVMQLMLLIFALPIFSYDPTIEVNHASFNDAQKDAEKSINRGDLFLYSSGGFVCSPKSDYFDSDYSYREIVNLFPVVSLACGCTNFNHSLERYAYNFNNRMLEYAINTPAIEKMFPKPQSGSFYSRIREIIQNPARRSRITRKYKHVK